MLPYRIAFFFAVIAAYAVGSSSTPDAIGIPEVIIAGCLVGMIGVTGGLSALIPQRSDTIFIAASRAALAYLIAVPLMAGAIRGSSTGAIIRDVIPLLYMFLFLFMARAIRRDPTRWLSLAAHGLLFIGVCFSVRFYMLPNTDFLQIGRQVQFGDMRYFPQDPAVTFASVFGMLEAFRAFERRRYFAGVIYAAAAFVAFAALAGMMVRAAILLTLLVLVARVAVMRASGALGFIVKGAALSVVAYAIISALPVLSLVAAKFEAVGTNSKTEEMTVLWEWSGASFANLVFGTGWGGEFETPTYLEPVRYVHNLPGYLLLKAGLVGGLFGLLIVFRAFLVPLVMWPASTFGRGAEDMRAAVLGAGLATFSSALFLQPTFKSLSFGLILLAVILASRKERRLSHSDSFEREVLGATAVVGDREGKAAAARSY